MDASEAKQNAESKCQCSSAMIHPAMPLPSQAIQEDHGDAPCSCEPKRPEVQAASEVSCCGFKPEPPASADERPGYAICSFVEAFRMTAIGPVPQIRTRWRWQDWVGTLRMRLNIGRGTYRLAPGLYSVGHPGADAPVLVSANYKLTFDHLRRKLAGLDVWLLVVDTRGVNVWCAAGKKTFSSTEVVRQVQRSGLERIVRHRRLILPQLAATGVAAHEVKQACGFRVVWGPLRAEDIKAFLAGGQKATSAMRQVTFGLGERMVLIPVELAQLAKPTQWVILAALLLSGIGQDLFSPSAAWYRGLEVMAAYIVGVAAGTLVVPALLPWLPGRAFALKGLLAGIAAGAMVPLILQRSLGGFEALALVCWTTAVSSFLAMNFTGSTPFTSPSGVEKEMRRALPLQFGLTVLAAAMWIGSAFRL